MPHYKKLPVHAFSAATRLILCRVALAIAVIAPVNLAMFDGPASSALAQAGAVRDIRVVGNRRVEPETVRSYLEFTTGDAYDSGKVDRSLRALFATGLFSDVRITRDGAAVLVTVVENPVISQVAFEGNSEVDNPTLLNEVQLKPRSVYTRARALADVQRILDVYRRQGRFAASVEPKLIELDQNRVNLVYEIKEGAATKVQKVTFVGNRAFSDSQLRDIVSTTQSGWFDFLKGTNIYDPDRVNLDKELLRQYYLKNGYADVRIVAGNAEIGRDAAGFLITYSIEEGELYNFGSVRVDSSLSAITPASLQGDLLTTSGQVYNASNIEKTVEKLTLKVSDQGFAFARVRPNATRNAATKTMDLVYVIDEGARVYIERINVVGNTRTKDFVVRREFRLVEGDAYNPSMVDRAKKRLEGLGFFKTANVKRRPGSAQDRVILDVELVEQPTGELSFGAGFSTNEGVIGDVSITERNLLGNGQFLRLKLAGSLERFQIDLSFTEPRFLDRNIAAGFDLFHKEVNALRQSSYKSKKTGGSLRVGFPLAENLWINSSYTLSYDKMTEIADSPSRAVKEAFDAGGALTSSVGSAITYDGRNHPKNPNRGVFFQLAGDFAGVGGDVRYNRVQAEGRAYYPITDQITFVGRGIAGHIEGWGGQDVRLLDLFYKGGETVRGFDKSGIGPRDTVTGDALGGKTFWATTAEVRFPIPLIPEELGISGAGFADAGSLYDSGSTNRRISNQCESQIGQTGVVTTTVNPATNVVTTTPVIDPKTGLQVKAYQPNKTLGTCLADSNSIRTSIGASILWNSPLGPLRLDYAKALSLDKNDKEKIITFGASTKF
jgi:outer membrane protein insertion porin family